MRRWEREICECEHGKIRRGKYVNGEFVGYVCDGCDGPQPVARVDTDELMESFDCLEE